MQALPKLRALFLSTKK
jgi:hypothetical protein